MITGDIYFERGKLTGLKIREKMENQSINLKSFKAIDDSLFMLSLDDYSSPLDPESSSHNIIHSKNGKNQWADKALQFIVENNGRAGVNGEVRSYYC